MNSFGMIQGSNNFTIMLGSIMKKKIKEKASIL